MKKIVRVEVGEEYISTPDGSRVLNPTFAIQVEVDLEWSKDDATWVPSLPDGEGVKHDDSLVAAIHSALPPHLRIEEKPFDQLMSQIESMLDRSEKYYKEAEEDGDTEAAGENLRVSCVLKELYRLGKAFEENAKD